MPCDTIQTSSVEFSLAHTDFKLLSKALHGLGWIETSQNSFVKAGKEITFQDGKLVTESRYDASVDVNEIKRAYSGEVIKQAQKKYGWTLEQKGNKGKLKRRF